MQPSVNCQTSGSKFVILMTSVEKVIGGKKNSINKFEEDIAFTDMHILGKHSFVKFVF